MNFDINFTTDLDRGVNLLPEVFKNSPNMSALINAIMPEIQQVNDAQKDIFETININNAVGLQLDNIFGEILDLDRKTGQTDDDYRTDLKAQIDKISRSGEIESLKLSLKSLTNKTNVSLLEFQPDTVIMHVYVDFFGDIPNGQNVSENMQDLKVAGVKLDICAQLNSSAFVLSDTITGGSAGEGFAELIDGSDGGTFCRLLASYEYYQILTTSGFLFLSTDNEIITTTSI